MRIPYKKDSHQTVIQLEAYITKELKAECVISCMKYILFARAFIPW
jgi:hypothetical protein